MHFWVKMNAKGLVENKKCPIFGLLGGGSLKKLRIVGERETSNWKNGASNEKGGTFIYFGFLLIRNPKLIKMPPKGKICADDAQKAPTNDLF